MEYKPLDGFPGISSEDFLKPGEFGSGPQAKIFQPRRRCPVIVIRGLPGSGKTTLSNYVKEVSAASNPFQLNADQARKSICDDLGFSPLDRLENAERLGKTAWLIREQGMLPIVDFVMPTIHTYRAFQTGLQGSPMLLISLSRGPTFVSRFKDTAAIFESVSEWFGSREGGVKEDFSGLVYVDCPRAFEPQSLPLIASGIYDQALRHVDQS